MTTTIRTYNYGAAPPTQGLARAMHQYYLKQRYWNALTRWELHRRWLVQKFIQPFVDNGMTYKEALITHKAKIKTLGADRTNYVREQRQAVVREGLYYPGYLDVEAAWNVARVGRNVPKLKLYGNCDGSINFPFTNGLEVSQLYGDDRRVQIDPVASNTYDSREIRRKNQRTLLRLRIGTEGREPVWLELPVFLHRPLPENCNIRSVRVSWRAVAGVTRWSVSITVREEAKMPALEQLGSVAIDLAWRKVDGKLRACYWRGTDGIHGELLLDETFLLRWSKVDELQSIRDHHLDHLKSALVSYLSSIHECPEWLRQQSAHMNQWTSQARFSELLKRWRKNRWYNDERSYELLAAWGKRERHLYSWQANLKDKLLTERRERYRVLAAHLSKRYDTLVLEAFDLRAVSQLKQRATDLPQGARRQRVIVAPSVLRLCLANAFEREGKTVVRVEAKGSSSTCHICNSKEIFNVATELVHTCKSCGLQWDQDDNACHNLLARAANLKAA